MSRRIVNIHFGQVQPSKRLSDGSIQIFCDESRQSLKGLVRQEKVYKKDKGGNEGREGTMFKLRYN